VTAKPGARTTWKSSSRKRKRARGESWVERLEPLAELRAAFVDCHSTITRRVLTEYLPPEGRVIEIGAGLGQLRSWLDEAVGERVVHADPDVEALAVLSRRFPSAKVSRARAESLPFEDESCAAVVGLCVLDVLADLDAALREIHRVLVPGGVLVHFLDMAPKFEAALRELASEGSLVLPNLFSDPCDEPWPADMLLTERSAMHALLIELEKGRHPLPHVFGHYFQNFFRSPFDAAKAGREYEAFARTPTMRELLKTLLISAYAQGHKLGLPPPRGVLASSGQRLARRLSIACADAALVVELNDVRTARSSRPATEGEPTYRSLALGHERRAQDLPDRLLCADEAPPTAGNQVIEAAVSVVVARRPPV
jgi:SAM-dependent methyltransferase